MTFKKNFDLVIIWLWPIIASLISFKLTLNFIGSTILFLLLPCIYLSIRDKKQVKRVTIFSLVGMPFVFFFEYFAVKSKAWYFTKSIFDYRIFDTIILEVLLWYFLWVYFVIIYYEYFLDKHCTPKLYSSKLKYPFIGFMILFAITIFVAIGNFSAYIPYYYLIIGLIMAILPVFFTIFRFPKLLNKLVRATLYFFYLYLVMDLTEIALGHWVYPGKFIGWFELFGIAFPVEELFVWVIFGAASLISWFEYFDDDSK